MQTEVCGYRGSEVRGRMTIKQPPADFESAGGLRFRTPIYRCPYSPYGLTSEVASSPRGHSGLRAMTGMSGHKQEISFNV